MEPRSTTSSRRPDPAIHLISQGRIKCPARNGTMSWPKIRPMDSQADISPALGLPQIPTRKGVTNTPNKVEPEAQHTAAEILPRATLVSAMADCTVDGRKQRNRTPR